MKAIPILFVVVFLFSCKKNDPITISSDGLIAHYTFSGNASDQSKYGNNGSVFNATLTTDSLGMMNSAYYFNGNSYVEIPDNNALDIYTNKLTISAWINPSVVSGTYVVQKSTTVNGNGQLTGGGGPYSLDIFSGKARALIYGTDNSYVLLSGTSIIKKDVWQHLAVTWDGNQVSLYYNGQLEASSVFSKKILVTNGKLHIGAYEWVFPNAAFNGKIDNVRLYERSLSAAEIQSLYTDNK